MSVCSKGLTLKKSLADINFSHIVRELEQEFSVHFPS